jgi:hypothetical protein
MISFQVLATRAIVAWKYARVVHACRMRWLSSVAVARFEALTMSSAQRLKSTRRLVQYQAFLRYQDGKHSGKVMHKVDLTFATEEFGHVVAIALTRGVRLRIMLGINPLFANLRSRVAGGSLVIIHGISGTGLNSPAGDEERRRENNCGLFICK